MEKVFGFFSPFFIYILIFILNALLPGRWVTGYVIKTGSTEKLKYRLNGLLVLAVVLITWIIFCYSGILDWDWLYTYRWYTLAGAITFGLIFSFAIVLPFPAVKKSFLADFYLGRLENPQLWGGRIDAKMWLYLVGAIMLELNVLSFAAHHHLTFGSNASPGVFMAAALLSFFVVEYLFFEEVHLYTYDFLAERVGFKLGWGDTAFYPYFYAIPLWAAVDLPDPQTPAYLLVIYGLIFLSGWCLARGANMQKYTFKKNPEKSFLGIKPETITDGNKSLLVSGFWGLSRHINYMGEILMATGIVLCAGHPSSIWPWLYPLYYVALLFPRQMADGKLCARKYGALWDQYVKKVPYRIIPFVY
jgi:protein-S-isoprenylcysteine O-methyltransferase Ste14